MDKLDMDLEGRITLRRKTIKVKPVGKPLVLWCPEGQEETNDIRFDNIMQNFAGGVATDEIPDAYLKGKTLKKGVNYTPVQFYKIENTETNS